MIFEFLIRHELFKNNIIKNKRYGKKKKLFVFFVFFSDHVIFLK